MDELQHLKTKVAYLKQENSALRDQLLDVQIQAGIVYLSDTKEPTDGNND